VISVSMNSLTSDRRQKSDNMDLWKIAGVTTTPRAETGKSKARSSTSSSRTLRDVALVLSFGPSNLHALKHSRTFAIYRITSLPVAKPPNSRRNG
jgi:hypothetical protein